MSEVIVLWHKCARTCSNGPDTKMPAPPQWFQQVDSRLGRSAGVFQPGCGPRRLGKTAAGFPPDRDPFDERVWRLPGRPTFLIGRENLIAALESVRAGEFFPAGVPPPHPARRRPGRNPPRPPRPPSQTAGGAGFPSGCFPALRHADRPLRRAGSGVCESGRSCWDGCMSWCGSPARIWSGLNACWRDPETRV